MIYILRWIDIENPHCITSSHAASSAVYINPHKRLCNFWPYWCVWLWPTTRTMLITTTAWLEYWEPKAGACRVTFTVQMLSFRWHFKQSLSIYSHSRFMSFDKMPLAKRGHYKVLLTEFFFTVPLSGKFQKFKQTLNLKEERTLWPLWRSDLFSYREGEQRYRTNYTTVWLAEPYHCIIFKTVG